VTLVFSNKVKSSREFHNKNEENVIEGLNLSWAKALGPGIFLVVLFTVDRYPY
jgi:hypothetical protein